MKIYTNDKSLQDHRVIVRFKGELADGDGLGRESFSCFMDEFLIKLCEGFREFVPIVQPEFGVDELSTVGTIFYHFFSDFGVFPFQLSLAAVINGFSGHVSDDILVESFLSFIPQNESRVLRNALCNKKFAHMDIVRVMSNHVSRINPTQSNLKDLVVKVAKSELITKPFVAFMAFKESFSGFFDHFGEMGITSLYKVATPTAANVMDYLLFDEPVNQQEDKTFHWLESYLRDLELEMPVSFLRFSTGSGMILPGHQIAVHSDVMPEEASAPKAKTCIKALTVP